MRDLDGKPLSERHAEAAEKPGGRRDQADRRGGSSAEAADHRGIDELQHYGSQLGQDGRAAEQERQPDTLPRRQVIPLPDETE